MKKAISAIMAFTMLFSLASCSQSSKYSLSNIKLTDSERSRVSPEEKYSELVAKNKIFYYARKIDENLMCVVQLTLTPGKSPEEFEKLFI